MDFDLPLYTCIGCKITTYKNHTSGHIHREREVQEALFFVEYPTTYVGVVIGVAKMYPLCMRRWWTGLVDYWTHL
jgi:hypothetical protein